METDNANEDLSAEIDWIVQYLHDRGLTTSESLSVLASTAGVYLVANFNDESDRLATLIDTVAVMQRTIDALRPSDSVQLH